MRATGEFLPAGRENCDQRGVSDKYSAEAFCDVSESHEWQDHAAEFKSTEYRFLEYSSINHTRRGSERKFLGDHERARLQMKGVGACLTPY